MQNNYDTLREVLRGIYIDDAHYHRVRATLLRAVDETEMRDRLQLFREREPGIFVTPNKAAEHHADVVRAVLKESNVKPQFFPTLKSILRWGTNRETMLATVHLLKTKNAPDWFWSTSNKRKA